MTALLLAGVLNELRALRTELAGTPFTPLMSPGERRRRDQRLSEVKNLHDHIVATIRGSRR